MSYYDGKQADEIFKQYASLRIIKEVIQPNLRVNIRDGLSFSFSEQFHSNTLSKTIQELFDRLREENKDLEEIQRDIQTLAHEMHF